VLIDRTQDQSLYVLRTTSDIDGGTYYLYDVRAAKLQLIGTSYRELAKAPLGRLQTISYPARDGVSIPGYLMTPPGARAAHVLLIVMPHGEPIARDSWRFDFLQQFLVSRGYAVLQMNFAGSSGYGDQWYFAAHQDRGGLTYSDIEDGAKWAIAQGIADPAHVCILGWSFGGYAALLGAVRGSGLYRCAVSIAGVSDLSLLLNERQAIMAYGVVREQIGSNAQQLAADSPRRHAADVGIPVLMIHGDRDAQVPIEQSKAMASALSAARKPFEFQLIPGADHQMSRHSDRTAMLEAIEKFLSANLGPGVTAAQ
jgi:dipeptidyl aminopeptidase/acylaminoacyl peptidase